MPLKYLDFKYQNSFNVTGFDLQLWVPVSLVMMTDNMLKRNKAIQFVPWLPAESMMADAVLLYERELS